MKTDIPHNYLVAGGSGFIGSNIVKALLGRGLRVTAIDGLFGKTGGRRENLAGAKGDLSFIEKPVEKVEDLERLVAQSDVVIDCMAWSSHLEAMSDPLYDMRLNLASHLSLLSRLPDKPGVKVVLLSSRGVYGSLANGPVTENTPTMPVDIQGVHKLACESSYRIYSKTKEFDAVSLRFANCFGENQPVEGEDIGLVGGFIWDLVHGKEVEIFGSGRKRTLVYVKDVVDTVMKLCESPSIKGFTAYNLGGHYVTIEDLVKELIDIIGRGSYRCASMPTHVGAIDVGSAPFDDSFLTQTLGAIPRSGLRKTLETTVAYFMKRLEL